MDHYGDGFWRRHNSPIFVNGRFDEPRKNSGHNDSYRHVQCVQERGRRRSSMRLDDGMPIYHAMAENWVRDTVRLHHTDEHENAIVDRNKTQWISHQMEQHCAKSGESQSWTNDPDEFETLKAMDQARFTPDGIHFDSIEGQGRANCVQERLDEMEVRLFDIGVLRVGEAMNKPAISTFVPPNLETRLGSVPEVPQVPQSSSQKAQRSEVLDRLGKAPVRRTIHPRRRLGPVNPTVDTTSGTSRSDTTSTSSEERRPDRSVLMWSRPIPSLWNIFNQKLMKLNLQTVKFAADAMKMLNGAKLSVNRLYSIVGADWLIAAGINLSSTTALRFDDLDGLLSKNTMGPVNARPLQDVRMNHGKQNWEERPGRFLTTRASIRQHLKMFKQVQTPSSHVKKRLIRNK